MSKVRKMKIIYEGARKLYAKIIFRKHNQHFKLLSSRKIYTWNQISTCRKPNLSLTSSIYLVFLPLEIYHRRNRLKQTKIYHRFLFFTLSENKRPTNLKSGSWESFFSSVMLLEQLPGVLKVPFKPSIWKDQIYDNSKLFRYLRYKFFDVIFLILENITQQMPLLVIYQTRKSLFWSTRYSQREINTC